MRLTGCPGIMSDMARKAIGALKTTPDPKPPRHVDKLGIGFFLQGYCARLQRHPTDRAGAGLRTHDFRMHRADVLGLYGWSGGGRGFQSHAALGASARFGFANLGIHRTDVSDRLCLSFDVETSELASPSFFLPPRRGKVRMGVPRLRMHASMMLLIGAGLQKLLRVFFELGETVMAAKIVGLARYNRDFPRLCSGPLPCRK